MRAGGVEEVSERELVDAVVAWLALRSIGSGASFVIGACLWREADGFVVEHGASLGLRTGVAVSIAVNLP